MTKKPDPHSLEAKEAAEYRLALMRRVRQHVADGNDGLPSGLTSDDVNIIRSGAAGDHDIIRRCMDWF